MNKQHIIDELKKKYPDKTIICIPEENPSEIICEIEPTSDHPEKSVALAIIRKSEPHYHKKSTEIYEVVQGTLTLHVGGKKHILQEGEKMTINPGQVHSAEGNETWFLIYSTPGWTHEDHLLVELK